MIENEMSAFFFIWDSPYLKITRTIDEKKPEYRFLVKNLFPNETVYSEFWAIIDWIQSKKWGYTEGSVFLSKLKETPLFKNSFSNLYFKNDKGNEISTYYIFTETLEKNALLDENGIWIEAIKETYQKPKPIQPTPTVSPIIMTSIEIQDTINKIVEKTSKVQLNPFYYINDFFNKNKLVIIAGGIFLGYLLIQPSIIKVLDLIKKRN